MKVALVANTDWYLYNYKLAFAAELARRGHDITLVSPPGEYHHFFAEFGFRWVPLSFSRKGINPLEECLAVLRFISFYRARRYDLVHHFTIKPVLYGSLAAKLIRVPHIINSIAGLGYLFAATVPGRGLAQRSVLFLYRLALKDTTVIFQNPEHREFFLANTVVGREDSGVVLGSGVDLTEFAAAPEPVGTPIVLMASRLIWEKGVREFVAAASGHRRGQLSARYVLVGAPDPGNPSSVPQSQLEDWHSKGLIEWWGWQDNMPEVLRSASIVCLPSFYGEGLPRVLVEAAAIGRAVIAADIPGSREVVRHGENGFLIPPGNQKELRVAIETLLLDPELRKKMGQAGRRIAQENFSIERINTETLAFYPGNNG